MTDYRQIFCHFLKSRVTKSNDFFLYIFVFFRFTFKKKKKKRKLQQYKVNKIV